MKVASGVSSLTPASSSIAVLDPRCEKNGDGMGREKVEIKS
jgi:hypothetical protein